MSFRFGSMAAAILIMLGLPAAVHVDSDEHTGSTPEYSYDASKPLNPQIEKMRVIAPGISAREFHLVSPTGNVITGEIISGGKSKSRPGALFLHWLGEPKTTNRSEFEGDAIALARKGATSVLIDLLWARPKWFDTVGKDAQADVAQAQKQVIDIRRALDLLEQQPGVDATRLALVGHDFGAMFGALALESDARPRVFVCMAAVPTLSEWYLLGKREPQGYVAALDKLDIGAALRASKVKATLFQFAAKDHYVTAARAQALFEAAPLPKGEFLYETSHDLAVPEADRDRRNWLTEQLFQP